MEGSAEAMRPRRGRIGAAMEERILRAAEEVFAERGFRGATTAAIAERAGVAKPSLHYYFGTKEALYRAVLKRILELWLDASDEIAPDADPATALAAYIARKVEHSRTRPLASKVFANELLHGAPEIRDFLAGELKRKVERKAAIIRRWIGEGRLAPVDPAHLFFVIWAATQTYADFDVQVAAVLGRSELLPRDYESAARTITQLVLRGCGLAEPTPP